MNEFTPRIDMITADRGATARFAPSVVAIQPLSPAGTSAGEAGVGSGGGEQARREHMASASEYARIQARVADILADVSARGTASEAAIEYAADHLAALREPTVIVPMPPASIEVVERVLQLARDMAAQAALARAAQSNVQSRTVDQLLATPL